MRIILQSPKTFARFSLLLIAVTTLALTVLVKVSAWGSAHLNAAIGPSWETAVVINPTNNQNIIIADSGSVIVSQNQGQTFTPRVPLTYPSPSNGGCGDASITADGEGRTFLGLLSCGGAGGVPWTPSVIQIDPSTGNSMSEFAFPKDPTEANDDKPWIAADHNLLTTTGTANPQYDNLYYVFDRFFGACSCWRIMFSSSTDHGSTWSTVVAVSQDPEDPWPATVSVGLNGEFYIAYRGSNGSTTNPGDAIYVLTSFTGGPPFAKGSFAISDIGGNLNIGSPPTIPGITFWTLGLNSAYVVPDPSDSQRLYAFADGSNSSGPSWVYLSISRTGGQSWSTPSPVGGGPAGSGQYFARAAVDDSGTLVVYWYDDRAGNTDAAGTHLLDIYATLSHDGGQTWVPSFKIDDHNFNPGDALTPTSPNSSLERRIGEYIGAGASTGGFAYATWYTTNGGMMDSFPVLAPEVDAIVPDHGPSQGGVSVTVTGANFTPIGTTTVNFGSAPALSTSLPSVTAPPYTGASLQATTPPGVSGSQVAVRVTDYKGESALDPNDVFTYYTTDQPILSVQNGCDGSFIEAIVYGPNGYPAAGDSIQFSASTPIFPGNKTTTTVQADINGTISLEVKGYSGLVTAVDTTHPGGSTTVRLFKPYWIECTQLLWWPTSKIPVWNYPDPSVVGNGVSINPVVCEACGGKDAAWKTQFTPTSQISVVLRTSSVADTEATARNLTLATLGRKDFDPIFERAKSIQTVVPVTSARYAGPVVAVMRRNTPLNSPTTEKIPGQLVLMIPTDRHAIRTGDLVRVMRLDTAAKQERWTDAGVSTLGRHNQEVRAIASTTGIYTVLAMHEQRRALTPQDIEHEHSGKLQ